jgi:phosphonate degradation associated HDIG domain protein
MKIMVDKLQFIVDEIFLLYKEFGEKEYIGEPVSQIEHMSQAASLAQSEGYDDEVILAAFFHDIGHLCKSENVMEGLGNLNHEEIGAEYLRVRGFSSRLIKLVKSHVIAKRYLTYKYPEYYAKLSDASKQTLKFQGGVMNSKEAAKFDKNPDKELIIKMRVWDDMAKLNNIELYNMANLREMTLRHLKANVSKRNISLYQ